MPKRLKNSDSVTIRPLWQRVILLLLFLSFAALFSGLGGWQLQRLSWKQELMATVDARLQADPVPIPVAAVWANMKVEEQVYQRVYLAGVFNHAAEVQSLAVSELGSGYWVMTPLQLEAGGTVLINRGFVPQSMRDPATRPASPPMGKVVVTGLLRASEPQGGFLRDNDPDTGRWYSRDIAAIAQAKHLTGPVAAFFVDADSRDDGVGSIDGFPRAGLTVVTFRNTHLVYALTWFTLAVLSAFGVVLLLKEWRRADPLAVSELD